MTDNIRNDPTWRAAMPWLCSQLDAEAERNGEPAAMPATVHPRFAERRREVEHARRFNTTLLTE